MGRQERPGSLEKPIRWGNRRRTKEEAQQETGDSSSPRPRPQEPSRQGCRGQDATHSRGAQASDTGA